MGNIVTAKTPVREFKEFKEFSRQDKEKFAAVVEGGSKEFVVSPIIDDYVFASSRAVDYGDYYGNEDSRALYEHAINKNADYFDTSIMHEIIPFRDIPRYMTFKKAGMYMDHNSKNAENSIGFIFDAFDVRDNYEDMHISLLFGIDKQKAPRIARSLEKKADCVATSMGCSIQGSFCTVCGKSGCDHLKYMRGGRVGGQRVAEFLLGFEFFEDSIVGSPACHTAYVIDALSSILPGRILKIAAADDEMATMAQIMASVYESIKTAKTHEEKVRLSDNLDRLIIKLESLAQTNQEL